jgi:homoserine acetyltransferase
MYIKKGKLIVLLKQYDLVDKCLKIEFSNPLAHRIVNESGRMKTLDNPSIYTFCKTDASKFLEWFDEESYGMFDDLLKYHDMVFTSDNIIDVITQLDPEVSWINL